MGGTCDKAWKGKELVCQRVNILDSETTWSFVDINSHAKSVILSIGFFIFRSRHLIVGIHRISACTKVIVRRKWAPGLEMSELYIFVREYIR